MKQVLQKTPLEVGNLIAWIMLSASIGFVIAWVIQASRFPSLCGAIGII